MQFAVNYSRPLAALVREGAVQIDRYKCPAWPDMVAEASESGRPYVHFPLAVGLPGGEVRDTETGAPIDWQRVDTLLASTDTAFVNAHLMVMAADAPDIPRDTEDPAHEASITARLIDGLETLTARYGRERVIAENVHSGLGRIIRPVYQARVITAAIEAADCGLLLDVSHARLAAHDLGVDPRRYLEALPLDRIREMHITGIQSFAGPWRALAEDFGMDPARLDRMAGEPVDHLPLTEEDFAFMRWVVDRINAGGWARPELVTLEYGGEGGFWALVTDADVLAAQVPRLADLFRVPVGPLK